MASLPIFYKNLGLCPPNGDLKTDCSLVIDEAKSELPNGG